MAAAFGICFGSTTASLAVYRDGRADVVANEAGDRVTPTLVSFTDHDINVGLPAKLGLIRNAKNTVGLVKEVIGHKFDDPEIENISKRSTAKIVDKSGFPHFQVEYKEKCMVVSPLEIATHIFKNLIGIADSHGVDNDSHYAVLSIPVHFNDAKKAVLCEAANRAGFKILRVISEPSASLLAYDIGQAKQEDDSYALVFRLGHENCDVSVLAVRNGIYQLMSSVNSREGTGRQITGALVDYFASEFKRQWKQDCRENKRSQVKLQMAAESCKHILSTMPSSQCSVDSLFEGIDFQCNMSRGRFEGICGQIIQSSLRAIDEGLNEAAMSRDQINKVILCGGSSKIPYLQNQISGVFPNADILTSIPCDEVTAIGAAKQAGILVGIEKDDISRNAEETVIPCLSSDVTIKSRGGDFIPVLKRNTPIPCRKSHTFKLEEDQTSFTCDLFTANLNNENEPLARISMSEVTPEGQITLTIHAKGDGSLHVTCTDPVAVKNKSITIEAS